MTDRNILRSEKIGIRKEPGADWPVYLELWQDDDGKYLISQLCNNSQYPIESYESRDEAEHDFNSMLAEMQE